MNTKDLLNIFTECVNDTLLDIREGEVVVRMWDDGSTYAVQGAHYDEETKELVITIA